MPYSISADNKTMTVSGINPATYSDLSITLKGRPAGDVNGDGRVSIKDARDVAWFSVKALELSENALFYGNVNGDEKVSIRDARDIAWKSVNAKDKYYNDVS
jgi:hypothetical protein